MTEYVIVTGGAGSLGRVFSDFVVDRGWQVAAVDLAPIEDGSAALKIGGVDLTNEASVARAFLEIEETFGRLDGLVNIAGGFCWQTVEGGNVDAWDKLYALNVRTSLVATRAALPLLKKCGGSIVNIGAAASTKAGMGMGAYAASKAGVARLTEALAEEMKDEGVRVNAVLPGVIDTVVNRAEMPNGEFDRWVSPHALAAAIHFLLSKDASAVTGALLPVTGRL